MQLSIEKNELIEYVTNQVNTFFPDKYNIRTIEIKKIMDRTLDRTNYSFSQTTLKYYNENGIVKFNHLHSDQYSMFLWFLSNEAFLNEKINIAEKLFYLNKALNCIDALYSIKLPDIFMFCHPIGTILGNAHYKNYLVVYQAVTIGASIEEIYPTLEENVTLFENAKVIGNCHIGKNVTISSGTTVINTDIPNYTIVFGQGKELVLKDERKKGRIINYTYRKA